ncbi:restriction endonuclease subunit S [Emticicia oligotrophica]|uniref:restriction endonuclease subunit S n=1 Tax=Emticicia oligotrophica TaxID=312279 RepID=UPI00273BC635|nr:restriction endonuclease subunit S [Emticicia oligotrophica]
MKNKLPKYDNYKPSNVEWLGEIPQHWEVTSVKHLLSIPITDGPHTTPELLEEGVPFISAEAIKNGKIDFSKKRGFISKKEHKLFSKKYSPQKGDIYMVKSGATTGNVAMVNTDDDFSIWSPLAVFRANNKKIHANYLHFILQSTYFKNGVELSWSFGTQQNIGMGILSNLPIAYGNISEQEKIAQFLDEKTTKIDQAVGIKQRQIELLKERRQILIHRAVTRGVDTNVPLKDSGVEWIGEIPEHWEVKALKFSTKIFRGKFTHRPRNDERLYDGIYPFFQTGDVARADKFLSEYKQTLNDFGLRVSTLFPKGTIVMTIAANIGDIAILDIDACFPDSIVGFNPMQFLERDFLYNSLLAMKEQFMSSTIKNTQMNLNVDRIGTNSIAIPPIEEQKAIVSHIENISAKISKAIGLKEREIEVLKEYKSSLINSAVTGKVKIG